MNEKLLARLSEMEAMEKKATPGPWFAIERNTGGRVYAVEICGDGRCRDCSPWREGLQRWSSRVVAVIQDWVKWTDHPANRDLIIAARNSHALLIALVRAYAERDAARETERHSTSQQSREAHSENWGGYIERCGEALADAEEATDVAIAAFLGTEVAR